MKKFKKLALTLILSAFALSLVACGNTDKSSIKIGVVGEKQEVWDYVIDKLKDENINVELVKFTDYNQPNDALLSKDIELNAFQHQIFLDKFNEDKKSNLVAIGNTELAPLGIYSSKIKSVDEIKNNDKIAIPDDITNEARSLVLLQSAGLIKVKNVDFPTLKDIEENNKNLEIIEMDASQTARSLDDVAVSLINNGVATDAGFIPTEDAIFLELVDKNSKPYINIIVSRFEDKDNEIYKKIVEVYQEEDTKKIIEESSKGSAIPAWDIDF